MKRIVLWPYKMGSEGAKELQAKINELAPEARCLRVRSDGNYRPYSNHLIVNWGNSNPPLWYGSNGGTAQAFMQNHPDYVAVAANKLDAFRRIIQDCVGRGKHIITPTIGCSKEDAIHWLQERPMDRIYCRTKLTGHSGDGIVVARTIEELVDAPLYTVGIDARAEYRVHVFNGEVLDIQKKRGSNDALAEDRLNSDIRNLAGGWVYARNNVDPPTLVVENAKRAVEALGLDFGAVDIIEEKRTGVCYVLEVNTAPGISGTTCEKYANKLIELAMQ